MSRVLKEGIDTVRIGPRRGTGLTDVTRRMTTMSGPQYRWLDAEAARSGIPLSEMLRRAIDFARDAMPRQETENASRS